jgi:DNA-binding transcriptional regulator YhcF (GntR family)
LPSIRAIAESENVDRKTVAAAYRRLEIEGLVRVHPRSGVYLKGTRFPEAPGPLERLHRRWLETTYERANALGLDSRTILRLVTAVAETERQSIPVIECDLAQSETIAAELRQRLGMNTVACVLHQEIGDSSLNGAPFVITTPYHRSEVSARWPDRAVIEVTLSLDAMRELRSNVHDGSLAVLVATDTIARKLGKALERGQLADDASRVQVIVAEHPEQVQQSINGHRAVYLWPGTPHWAREAAQSAECVAPVHCLSEDSIARVRSAVLDASIRRAHDPVRVELDYTTTASVVEALTLPASVG